MAEVKISRNWHDGFGTDDFAEIEVGLLETRVLDKADPSDPLNQTIVVSATVGRRLGITVSLENADRPDVVGEAVSILLAWAVDHAAEIRDAMALAKEDR